MSRVGLVMFALFAFASCASANEIRWKSELVKPGEYVTIDQSQDGRIHHVFRGKSGGKYVLDSYRGKKPQGKPEFTTYLDKDGNYLRWVRKDGFEIRYHPHDCTRTLGQCSYTEAHSDGTNNARTRITKATKRGFSFKEYDQSGKFLFGGQFDIDAHGWAGKGSIDGYRGKQRYRLVKSSGG